MNKKFISIALIICFGISLLSLFHKVKIETSSKNIEYAINYNDLVALSKQTAHPDDFMNKSLKQFKNSGVSSLILPDNTVLSLMQRNIISVFSGDEMRKIFLATNETSDFVSEHSYFLIKKEEYRDEVLQVLHSRYGSISGMSIDTTNKGWIEINKPKPVIVYDALPYLSSDLSSLKKLDFAIVPEVAFRWEQQEHLFFDQLKKISKFNHVSKIFINSSNILGYPDRYGSFAHDIKPYGLVYREYFAPKDYLKGIDLIAKNIDYHIVRAHQIETNDMKAFLSKPNVLANRLTLAASERNIRLFLLGIPTRYGSYSPEDITDQLSGAIKISNTSLKKQGFKTGVTSSFSYKDTFWSKTGRLFAFISVILGISLLISYVNKRISLILLILGLSGVIVLFMFHNIELLSHVLGLLASIVFPLLGFTWLYHRLEKNKAKGKLRLHDFFYFFAVSSLVTLIGGIVIQSMYAHISYSLYLSQFKGVKLTFIAPPTLVLFLYFYYEKLFSIKSAYRLLNQSIKIYHVALVMVVFVGALYYLSRTGNAGVQIPFEQQFRNWLEHSLGIRPRTKEFLFGHPLLVVMIVYWNRYRFVRWLSPLAMIGQASMINTFTHLHTPFYISFVRGLLGLGFGFVIGLLFVLILKFLIRLFDQHIKPQFMD